MERLLTTHRATFGLALLFAVTAGLGGLRFARYLHQRPAHSGVPELVGVFDNHRVGGCVEDMPRVNVVRLAQSAAATAQVVDVAPTRVVRTRVLYVGD